MARHHKTQNPNKRREQIQQLVDETLEGFDSSERLKPNPYLYTRVQSQLQSTSPPRTVVVRVVRAAALAGLLAINALTVKTFLDSYPDSQPASNTAIATLAEEFEWNTSYTDVFIR